MRIIGIFIGLFLLVGSLEPLYAADKQFRSWNVGAIADNEGIYAATVNDSKAVFGQYCYPSKGNCFWLLANDITCESGSRYPVLINVDAGATSLEIVCFKVDGKARFAFTDFDKIDGIVKSSARIGIAFPMENGFFQVNRFSLDGAIKAVSFMRGIGETLMKKTTGTKDQRL